MEQEGVNVQPLIDTDQPPAPGAEEQKPTDANTPAIPADDQNREEVAETPEQQAARRESRRQRARMRDAAKVAAAETEARLLREQLARVQRPATPENRAPHRDDIDPETGQQYSFEEHLLRVAKHESRQEAAAALKAEREARSKAEQERTANEAQERTSKAWSERLKQAEAATKDFREVVGEYVDESKLSPAGVAAIEHSEVGPQLLYYLATNPAVAERIEGLSPVRQVAELGKLEDKLPQPKKASNAPPVVKTVSQGRSAPNGYSENMSNAEYEAWRATPAGGSARRARG